MIYWLRAALTLVVTLTRAREGQAVIPLLRGRSPTRSVAPKPLGGLGRASLGLPWARGCRRNPARRKRGLLVSAGRDAARGDRAGWAVPRRRSYEYVIMIYWLRAALTLVVTLNARARGPGRDPAVTGLLANEVGRAK